MNTVLTIINDNIDLRTQKILVYLKPLTQNSDWESSAWQACAPQPGGGSQEIAAITNEVGAYVSFDNNKAKTAYVSLNPGYIASIEEHGNELILSSAVPDNTHLTDVQSGIMNATAYTGLFPIFCLNGNSVCKPTNPMTNGSFSSFELSQKVYFTIGSSINTDTFKVQNWDLLQEIKLPSNLKTADVRARLDEATNKITFTIENQIYEH